MSSLAVRWPAVKMVLEPSLTGSFNDYSALMPYQYWRSDAGDGKALRD